MAQPTYQIKRSKVPVVIAIVCFIAQAAFHNSITVERHIPRGVGAADIQGIGYGPWFVAASGFREVVAAWLWIRCNDLFHEGDYQALVPLMRTIVALDPHQIDVYATGAWHMVYNFVDSQERSDRRYIPEGLSFLAQGIKNNPDPFDLYQDMGWMLFDDKLRRYREATPYFIKAREHKSPPFFQHTIAHSLEHEGNIDGCITWWNKFIDDTKVELAKDPNSRIWNERLQICEHNKSRVILTKNSLPDLMANPRDPALDFKMEVAKPYVLKVWGKSRLALGCRLYIDIQDIDYEETLSKPFIWRLQNVTVMEDFAFVLNNGSFKRDVDISQDPTFFPFTRDNYRVIVSFDPRTAPGSSNDPEHPAAQDVLGWSGEGLANGAWLYEDNTRPAHINGKTYPLRMLRKEIIITKDQLAKKKPFDLKKAAGLSTGQ